MGLTLTPRGPVAGAARPVPDRPLGPQRGHADHDRHRRAARRPLSRTRRGGGGLPGPFYGETPETMAAVLPLLLAAIERACRSTERWRDRRPDHAMERGDPRARGGEVRARHRPARPRRQGRWRPGPRPARPVGRPAADRLHDRHRRAGRSSPSAPGARPTSRRSRSSAAGRPTWPRSRAVREVFAGPIRVDANTGWTRDDAETLLPELVDLGVELIEQPFPARAYRDLGWLQERSPLPIVADESCVAARGPRGARRRRRRRQREARQVRRHRAGATGCSTEAASSASGRSSAAWRRRRSAIAASAVVASLADWVDLDGNLLLADDPFEGLELGPDKRWQLADRPGLGLTRKRRAEPVHARSARVFWLNARSCGKVRGRSRGQAPFRASAAGLGCRDTGRRGPQGGDRDTRNHRPADRSPARPIQPGLVSCCRARRARARARPGRRAPGRREGTPSMDPRTAATRVPDPDAVEFIRFCYRRRRVGWPELYDEMCAVAARGLFRGLVDGRSRRPRDRLQPLRHAGARGDGSRDRRRGAGAPPADDRGHQPPTSSRSRRATSQPSTVDRGRHRGRRSRPVREANRPVRFAAVPAGA